MKSLPLFACSLLFGLSSLAQAQPNGIAPGQQVLRACAATYKSLREFKGSASVISLSSLQTGNVPVTTMMRNADANFDFVRDSRFNIDGHDTGHQPFEIISTPQKTTYTWELGGKKETHNVEDIEMAVASFTGVAAAAPTTIPALLLNPDWGFPFKPKAEATLKGNEVFGGHQCYVIVQKEKAKTMPQTLTLWIDSKTFLLRGMREEQAESSFSVDIPTGPGEAANKSAPQHMQVHVLYANDVSVFSIEKTLPSEAELETAAPKIVDLPTDAAEVGH